MHTATLIVVIVVVGYIALHGHHARKTWRRSRGHPFGLRIRTSIKGPFGTRISKNW